MHITESIFCIEEYTERVRAIHGYEAPGVIIGGFMVHTARAGLPHGTLFNAVCETSKCLPDAIQLLTPCTIGNGWLSILDIGRFALSLYDKSLGNGFRVFLDPNKLKDWPEIDSWFFKLKPKSGQNQSLLLAQIKEADRELYGLHPIQVRPEFLRKRNKGKIVICQVCKEAYPLQDGGICRSCQGRSPYILPEDPSNIAHQDTFG
jgi:formylmethanofuran dehydrogenase subunit E